MPATVRHVLFYVPLNPGILILAEMGDGTLRILNNDEPVDDCRWDQGDIARALAKFLELKAAYLAG